MQETTGVGVGGITGLDGVLIGVGGGMNGVGGGGKLGWPVGVGVGFKTVRRQQVCQSHPNEEHSTLPTAGFILVGQVKEDAQYTTGTEIGKFGLDNGVGGLEIGGKFPTGVGATGLGTGLAGMIQHFTLTLNLNCG